MWQDLKDWIYNLRRRLFGRYELDDPRPIQKEAPYTYYLPSDERLKAADIGDHVQLLFRSIPPGLKYGIERMWVEILSVERDTLSGKLLNKPFDMPQVKTGTFVQFQRFHIIDVTSERPLPEDPPQRDYWDRCMVDRCVLDRQEPVYYIYRETPDMTEEGDKYPDSGWRIRGDYRHISDDELEARKASYIALGKVLNVDDSWLHLIDSPIDTAFIRNFETGQYEPYDRGHEE